MKIEPATKEDLQKEIIRLNDRIRELEQEKRQQNTEPLPVNTLKSIFRVAPAGIGMIRDGIFIEINPRVSEITGYSREELIEQNIRMLYSNDWDYEFVSTEAHKQIQIYGSAKIETIWKQKDGTLKNILLSSTPINENNQSEGVIFAIKDITDSKEAQSALESSKERLNVIFEHAPEAIYLCDTQGNYIDSNLAFENLLGFTREELSGQNFLEMGIFEQSGLVEAGKLLVCTMMGEKTGPDILATKRKDGDSRKIEISTYPVNINGKRIMLGMARDITIPIKQDKIRKDSEKKIAMHVNQTRLAVIEWDNEFKIASWNPGAENLFGYSQKEAIGQSSDLIVPQDTKEYVGNIWDKLSEQKQNTDSTNWNIHKNGNSILVEWHNTTLTDDDGEPVGVASFGLDVTEKHRADQLQKVIFNISNAANISENLNKLIKQIQEELSTLIDTKNFFLALYNKDTNTFILPFTQKEEESSTQFAIDKTLPGWILKNHRSLLANKATMQELSDNKEIVTDGTEPKIWLGVPLEIAGETIGVLAVGSYIDENAYSADDQKILEFVSTQISVSISKKKAEEEMTKALKKAKESDHLKSAFLANMSHEIRTPMNGILGFANLLRNTELSKEDQQKYISLIDISGNRMLGIINDLIDLSKIESGMTTVSLSKINLNETIEYINSFFQPEAKERGLELSYSLGQPEKEIWIETDTEKLHAILTNLVKNALKYTPEGSINFGYKIIGSVIRFKVEDTGSGIQKDKIKSIFDRFMQVNRELSSNHEGVGLGLAITKAYVELLNGTIWVESEYGKGSVFYFEIPHNLKNIEEKENMMEERKNEDTSKKVKILLAEDDKINQRLFSYLLKDIADEVVMVDNGNDAVETYEKNQDFDIILMDIKMPGLNGFEATEKIKAIDPDATIIGLSAFSHGSEKEKGYEVGFCDYISKPVNKKALGEIISKYI